MIHANWRGFFERPEEEWVVTATVPVDEESASCSVEHLGPDAANEPLIDATEVLEEPRQRELESPNPRSDDNLSSHGKELSVHRPRMLPPRERPSWHGTVVLGRWRWRGWLIRTRDGWVVAVCPHDDVRLIWVGTQPTLVR